MEHSTDYIIKLKECDTSDEVWNLMKGNFFPGTTSAFEDDTIVIPSHIPGGPTHKFYYYLKNNTLDLAHRIIIFLKLDGYFGPIPKNTGTYGHFATLQRIFLKLEEYQFNIKTISDINEETIKKYLIFCQENYLTQLTTDANLRRLVEWGAYGDLHLPLFLRFDISILVDTNEYSEIKKSVYEERKDARIIGGNRDLYDLKEMKKLIEFAINYIESYSTDVIHATRIYQESLPGKKVNFQEEKLDWKSKEYRKRKKVKNDLQYRYIYQTINESMYVFSEPKLKELQSNILHSKSMFLYGGRTSTSKYQRKTIKNPIKSIVDTHTLLEGSCIAVILLTTAMRGSELIALEIEPKITDGEYFSLARMVYKTAATKEGEEHIIPIPDITKKAIEILSKLTTIRNKEHDTLVLAGDLSKFVSGASASSLNYKISHVAKAAGVAISPTSHQFRHAMAFMIAYMNGRDGVELAQLFLKHTSYKMTLQYLGHYNILIKQALYERYREDSGLLVDEIVSKVKNGEKLFGSKGERLMPNHEFMGSCAAEFSDFLSETLSQLIDDGKALIIQTPVCFCIHDYTKPDEMVCQRGFSIKDFVIEQPIPSRCKGGECGNAIFTEAQIENLEIASIDESLKKRLEGNKFFVENGGFDNDPFQRMIKKYKPVKEVS